MEAGEVEEERVAWGELFDALMALLGASASRRAWKASVERMDDALVSGDECPNPAEERVVEALVKLGHDPEPAQEMLAWLGGARSYAELAAIRAVVERRYEIARKFNETLEAHLSEAANQQAEREAVFRLLGFG